MAWPRMVIAPQPKGIWSKRLSSSKRQRRIKMLSDLAMLKRSVKKKKKKKRLLTKACRTPTIKLLKIFPCKSYNRGLCSCAD